MLGGNCGDYPPYAYDQGPCCSPNCSKVWSGVEQVSVTITAADVVRRLEQTFQSPGVPGAIAPYTISRKTSDVAWGALLSGTHILTKTGSFALWSEWVGNVAGQPEGCPTSFVSSVSLRLYHQPTNNASGFHYLLDISVPGALWSDSQRSDGGGGCAAPQFYTADEMDCVTVSTACTFHSRAIKAASFSRKCEESVYGSILPSATQAMSGFNSPPFSSDWTLLSSTETWVGANQITVDEVEFS